MYHVVPAAARAASLTNGQVLPTLLANQTLTVDIAGTPPVVQIVPTGGDPATVIQPDIEANDAVGSIVHVIDTVLLVSECPALPGALPTACASSSCLLSP